MSARIAICGARVYTDPEIVTEELADGTRQARWTGVVLCNRAGCPVCGAAKARQFHQRLLRTLGTGGRWQHVTFTVPHGAGDTWKDVYSRLMAGLHEMSHGQAGRILRRGVLATVRATETTWGARNGWHVHFHVLWQVTDRLARSLRGRRVRRLIRQQWADRTGAHPWHGVSFGLLANCDHEGGRVQAASYLSKIAAEMAGHGKAAHPEHWTLGELYHRAARGEGEGVQLVQEYQRATKGRRLYQLDRRATQLHDNAPELPAQRIVATWTTVVDRAEFGALSRGERADPLAVYLPLEVAVRARGDPSDEVEDTIYGLLAGFGG